MANSSPVVWKQGEHIVVIGRTGSGKTYLVSKLVQLRQYVVMLRTKPDSNKFAGFTKIKRASGMEHWQSERLLLEPDYAKQAIEGYRMLDRVWRDGSWTCVVDENWYAEQIGLKPYIIRLLTQGRSKNISVVVGMQRPVDISRFSISECKHIFIFQCEGRDLKFTLRDMTNDAVVEAVRKLTKYHFVYFNQETRQVLTGEANQLGQIFTSTFTPQVIDSRARSEHDTERGRPLRVRPPGGLVPLT